MRTKAQVEFVLDLSLLGLNDSEIARRTGIPRRTVRDWRRHGGQHHGFGNDSLGRMARQQSCQRHGLSSIPVLYHSADIRAIFCVACDMLEVSWRQMNAVTISVARKDDVARLDLMIGPKA